MSELRGQVLALRLGGLRPERAFADGGFGGVQQLHAIGQFLAFGREFLAEVSRVAPTRS